MAIARFKDLPSTDTPINATNLNGNFDDLGVKVGTSVDNNYRTNIIKGKNLIDLSNMLISDGYSDTGFVASSNYLTIQYIQVKPNTTYTLSTNLSTSKYSVLRIVDFDNNKTFIRRSGGTALASSNTFTTSNDAYYIALCFYTGSTASTSDITQAQLEKGSTATTYEAYITPTINVDGENIYVKGQNEVYSTAEQVIGTWIDGKPLYEKTFYNTLPNTSASGTPQWKDLTIAGNIDMAFIEDGYIKAGNNILSIFFASPSRNANYFARGYIGNNQLSFMNANYDYNGAEVMARVRYTKTTD